MRVVLLFVISLVFSYASESMQDMIDKREKFFLESIAKAYDSAQITSYRGLEYIDFCSYPPDRSLVYGKLSNGRFKGEKINNLPFTCNASSGAKKFFLRSASLDDAYRVIKEYTKLGYLESNLPTTSDTISSNNSTTCYIFARDNKALQDSRGANRLWIIHTGVQRYTLIFITKGTNVEVIMQYLGI